MGGRHSAAPAWEEPRPRRGRAQTEDAVEPFVRDRADNPPPAPRPANPSSRPYSLGEHRIIDWLKKVKFRRQLIGGVSERSVWKQIQELDMLYLRALGEERARYDALLAEHMRMTQARDGPDQTGSYPDQSWGSSPQ